VAYSQELSFGAETRVILVGTSRCARDEANLPPLPQVEQNVLSLARLFVDPDVVGLPRNAVIPLIDRGEASEVVSEIAKAAREATDTLLVYFAGHGLYGDANTPLYLAVGHTTADGKMFDAVAINSIKQAMRVSPARKRILILDCCYSGRAFDGTMSDSTVIPAIDIEGTYGIAASPGDARALAPPDEPLTRFTGALVDVLERGVERDDAVLTLTDIFGEVEARIRRKADAPLPKQINWDKAGAFKFARNRSLQRSGLRRIEAAIDRLSEAVKASDKRLKGLEERTQLLETLRSRVPADAATAVSEGTGVPVKTDSAQERAICEKLNIPASVWRQIPADPFKLHIKRYLRTQVNLFIVLTLLMLPSIIFSVLTVRDPYFLHDNVFGFLSINGSIILIIAFYNVRASYLEKIPPVYPDKIPNHIYKQIENSDIVIEILKTQIFPAFGFDIKVKDLPFLSVVAVIGIILPVSLYYSL
jgi:hypothetical protein